MFYQRLHEICKQKGTTVTRMVKEIGLSSANLSNWKNGRLPKTEIAFKIAEYLEVSIYDLMGEQAPRPMFAIDKRKIDEAIERIVDTVYSSTSGEDRATKKPLSEEEKRFNEAYEIFKTLDADELMQFKGFVAGIRANRKPD